MTGTPSRPRRILLVDCDAFFVQVARAQDPEGAGRAPLLVVGGSPSGRGVVTSADYGVRAFGVRSGMPMARALRLCPGAVAVPVPREACLATNRRIREALAALAPVVEAASIDEFYLDLTGTERMLRGETLEATARRIRAALLEVTGISTSVGGAATKLVAKLAAGEAKPRGVRTVPLGEERRFLESFPLSALPGVGPAMLQRLARAGLRSVIDARRVQEEHLRRWLGELRGRWLWERVRGIDPSPVVAEEERKSISSERTFRVDLETSEVMERHLLQLALAVGRSLREAALRGRTLTVKIRDRDFRTRQASATFPRAVESDRALFRAGRRLLGELRDRRRVPCRLLGVGISNLEPTSGSGQLRLFEEPRSAETERDRQLSRLGDRVRRRFGPDALLPGRVLEEGREAGPQTRSPDEEADG